MKGVKLQDEIMLPLRHDLMPFARRDVQAAPKEVFPDQGGPWLLSYPRAPLRVGRTRYNPILQGAMADEEDGSPLCLLARTDSRLTLKADETGNYISNRCPYPGPPGSK